MVHEETRLNMNIKEYLFRKGIKHIAVARYIGVSDNVIHNYLRYNQRIPADKYLKICEFLSVSPEFFK